MEKSFEEEGYNSDELEQNQAKKDICCSPIYKQKEHRPSEEEIKHKIDEINEKYEEDEQQLNELDVDGAINIDEILISNNLSKSKQLLIKKVENIQLDDKNKPINCKQNTSNELEIFKQDNYLKIFDKKIKERINTYNNLLNEIEKNEGGLLKFCKGYENLGLNVRENGIEYREYAPGAKSMTIVKYILNLVW